MGNHRAEIEAKFFVSELGPIRQRIRDLGVRQLNERHLERNWRFDQPGRELTATGTVLRLRSIPGGGTQMPPTLTFKRRGKRPELREEIEFEIKDPSAAVDFLEALGYEVVTMYEKYRQTFALDACELMLDELPFGHFIEIEGPSLDAIRGAAEELGLRWDRRVDASYLELYERLKSAMDLPFDEVTFDNFTPMGMPDASLMSLACASADERAKS